MNEKKHNVNIFVWKFHCYLRTKNVLKHTQPRNNIQQKGQWYKLRRKKDITLLAQEKGPNFVSMVVSGSPNRW